MSSKKKEVVATVSDLTRLRDEYHDMARRCKAEAANARGEKAAHLRGMAAAYEGTWLDFSDMIEGKGHPSARRRG
ncbi:hypothetical protein [Stenotrophomonas sp. PS02298]|uniref:hypothetical protein n=1 Tax=Stenotrophomonas sp. PS02298 TaxID=2991424 RepID=UPI00249A71A3|nr:hypothetical protein [Stenotrophomonas sp. PS02298]